MMKRKHCSLLVFLILSLQLLLFSPICAFVIPVVFATATRRQVSLDASSAGDRDADDQNNAASDGSNINNSKKPMAGVHPQKESQELFMEVLSARGAARIARLSIPERAKRALLAEAVEDQIFANTEELERIMLQEADDDDGSGTRLPVEQRRQAVVEIASQTKTLQVQYQELVSGESSSVLNAMEAAFGGGESNKSERRTSSSTKKTKKDENAADDDWKEDGGERANC